jgi:hypothetical protein
MQKNKWGRLITSVSPAVKQPVDGDPVRSFL